ncbi:MAG: hypothetical protein P4N59_17110 [Negativicutes bacterium]|nr:hypothetical protein [Negativicutes bacterium]
MPARKECAGIAWSGTGRIVRVTVSLDGGSTWQDARLTNSQHSESTWTFWEFQWNADRPGRYAIMVKTEDAEGTRQPLQSPWNVKGYGNNGIHAVAITVPRPE